MNQAARALGWLRDLLILTEQDLPQALDTSGGMKPVLDIAGNGEPFGSWRGKFTQLNPGAIGLVALDGLPFPGGFAGSELLPNHQVVIASMSVLKIGATPMVFGMNLNDPYNAVGSRAFQANLGAAGIYSWKDLCGDGTRRFVVPPGAAVAGGLNIAIPAAESLTIQYVYCVLPAGLMVIT